MTKLVYEINTPPEVLAPIKALCEKWEWLIPGWVQTVNVYWCHDTDNGLYATNRTSYEYRSASLRFFDGWLMGTQEERENCVVHELLHCHTSVPLTWAYDIIESLTVGDDKADLRGHLLKELKCRHESMTQDMAYSIQQRNGEHHGK